MRGVALAVVMALAASGAARAQGVTPPPVPQLPDEPLPEWHPPPPTNRHALFLQMSPEMQQAQKLRQAGLWISSMGWAQLLLGGVLYAWAARVNEDLSSPPPGHSIAFHPAVEDERNRIQSATLAFLTIGTTMAVGGFVVYTIGQWRITAHHKTHPNEPLPPLSGF